MSKEDVDALALSLQEVMDAIEILIDHCLGTAPDHYTLHARNPAHTVTIGRDSAAVMPGGGPPFVLDLAGRRRPGTLTDLENFAKLSQMSPDVHVMARKAMEAQDVPVPLRRLRCWQAILTLTDKPGQSGFVNGRAEAEDVLQMLALVFGGEDRIDGTPAAHCYEQFVMDLDCVGMVRQTKDAS